jgi:hypothetical protein
METKQVLVDFGPLRIEITPEQIVLSVHGDTKSKFTQAALAKLTRIKKESEWWDIPHEGYETKNANGRTVIDAIVFKLR